MSLRRIIEGAVLAAALVGCTRASTRASTSAAAVAAAQAADSSRSPTLPLTRWPDGTLEISPQQLSDWLARGNRPPLRVVDVRERDELIDELGHIAGVESVPLGELAEVSKGWDPAQPIVLVCRSGRRSGRGAALLEVQGFANAAAMTGGMLRWHELQLPTSQSEADIRPGARSPQSGSELPVPNGVAGQTPP